MIEIINPNAKPLSKEQFYGILFGDKADEILRKEKMKEFYDKMHNQQNVELVGGRLWYTGMHTFTSFHGSTGFKAKQQLEIMRV